MMLLCGLTCWLFLLVVLCLAGLGRCCLCGCMFNSLLICCFCGLVCVVFWCFGTAARFVGFVVGVDLLHFVVLVVDLVALVVIGFGFPVVMFCWWLWFCLLVGFACVCFCICILRLWFLDCFVGGYASVNSVVLAS